MDISEATTQRKDEITWHIFVVLQGKNDDFFVCDKELKDKLSKTFRSINMHLCWLNYAHLIQIMHTKRVVKVIEHYMYLVR